MKDFPPAKKVFFAVFCLVIILIQAINILYQQRDYYLKPYDISYWKDRYEHSHLSLPASKRTIGDDGLYAYAGYRLIQGDNPFSINVDKPPAGKYLIGLSILLFRNPAYFALFFGVATLIVFYLIAKDLLRQYSTVLFVVTILFLDPLFFSQFWISGLDLVQLFFLLLSIFLLMKLDNNRRKNLLKVSVAGFALGFFAEIKPPILFPLIFILETLYLLCKPVTKRYYIFFIFGLFLGIILPYFRYLALGNGIVDVLRVHKFMASIYLQSQLKAHFGPIWQALFLGQFPQVITSQIRITEWWLLWPITIVIGISMAIYSFVVKRISVFFKGFAIFLLSTLFIYSVIPFYSRYLIIVLPFLYLLFTKAAEQFLGVRSRIIGFMVILAYGVINAFLFLIPTPDTLLNNFYYNFSRQYFQDIYQENLAASGRPLLSQKQFSFIAQKTLKLATVKSIEIQEKERNVPKFGNKGNAKITILYKTQDLGSFSEEKNLVLIKEDNRWKIAWDWNALLNDFLPIYTIETAIIAGKRGSIINKKGIILVQDQEGYLISINPEKIDTKREEEMLRYISSLSYQKPIQIVFLQDTYLENALPGEYIPLLTTSFILSEEQKRQLLLYPGVQITAYPTRVYSGLEPESISNTFYEECCTRIYSSYNYHGVRGLEKEYDTLLSGYSGGKIIIRDSKGDVVRTVLEKTAKNGTDAILSFPNF